MLECQCHACRSELNKVLEKPWLNVTKLWSRSGKTDTINIRETKGKIGQVYDEGRASKQRWPLKPKHAKIHVP